MEQMNVEAISKPGGARVKTGGGAMIALGIAGGLLAAALAGYLVLCWFASQSDTIWKGAQVLGQDLGGLTTAQAVQKVEAALPKLEIGVYLYDGTLESPPAREGAPDAVIPLNSLNADINTAALVQGADREARRGAFLTAGWRYLTSHDAIPYGGGGEDIAVDPSAAQNAAQETADRLSYPAQDTSYELGDNALMVRMAQEGRGIDARFLQEALEQGSWNTDLSLSVPYSMLPAGAMTAQEIHDAVAGEMKNAGYDAATDTIIPEQVGADFDVPAAQRLMDAAQPGETVVIPASVELPAVTEESLRAVLFRDLLGEAVTRVTGTAARISNVRLASSSVNGTVLNSGDVFSYNETVGQRTAAKGYQAAPAYVQGETVDEIGGGVCQPSSTLYLACLNSNLEITQRQAHRYVPSYIPPGMDATVSWGGPDYKFTNNTEYPIRIVAIYAGNQLTMQIWGTKTDDITVKMTNEHLSTTPYETVYEEDPSLAPGAEVVKTTPYTGYRYRTYRCLYDGSGNLISREVEAVSDYKSRNKVILRGPEIAVTAPAETGTPETPPEETAPPVQTETLETQTPPVQTETPPAETPPPQTETPPADEGPSFIILPAE